MTVRTASTKTSKLSIPSSVMAEWQRWRNEHGHRPQVSAVALFAFMRMEQSERTDALIDYAEWRESGQCRRPAWWRDDSSVSFPGAPD